MNIVLICLDSFRADCLAARGKNPVIKTPNLDRLANEGVLFTNAFGEGQPTIQFRRALCTGMRSFPFNREMETTGLWPTLPGWHRIPAEQPTLAEILLSQGYVTGMAASTWHMFKSTQNFIRGVASWDFIRGHEADPWKSGPIDAVDWRRYAAAETNEVGPSWSMLSLIQFLHNNRDRKGWEDYIPARLFSSAIDFVEHNADNAPFFLWIDSFSPHEPWDPPREYADAYDPDWDEDYLPVFPHRTDVSEKIKRRIFAQYHGEITFIDKQLGRLLETLDAKGLMDDTLIWVVSDHGAEIYDHGQIVKTVNQNRYRENAEILSIIRFPGAEHAGRRVDDFVLSHDIVPTILDAAGAKRPHMEGRNILPLITGEGDAEPLRRDHIVTGWAGTTPRAMVRTREFCYSCDFTEVNPDELLFDVEKDPREKNNLAAERTDWIEQARAFLKAELGELPYRGVVRPAFTPPPPMQPRLVRGYERWEF